MANLKPLSFFIEKSNRIYGDPNPYEILGFVKNKKPRELIVKCKKHNKSFPISPGKFLAENEKNRRVKCVTCKEEDKKREQKLHYQKIVNDYRNHENHKVIDILASGRVSLSCVLHDKKFNQSRAGLKRNGCPVCKTENMNNDKQKEIHYYQEEIDGRSGKGNYTVLRIEESRVGDKHPRRLLVLRCEAHPDVKDIKIPTGVRRVCNGCPKCAAGRKKNQERRHSIENFVTEGTKIHLGKYTYPKNQKYINVKTALIINCPSHGSFLMDYHHHINRKQGCPDCYNEKFSKSQTISVTELQRIIDDNWGVNLGMIIGRVHDNTKKNLMVRVACVKHWNQRRIQPNELSDYRGCSNCIKSSRGEMKIEEFLIRNNIVYERQKKFDDCVYKQKLSFDFHLKEHNLLIEFDGLQHKKPVDMWGGIETWKEIEARDDIKNRYAKDKNMELIRIDNFKEIETKLAFLKST